MRIAVCVKHAVDESELRLSSEGVPRLEGTPSKMSTFDKNAVEEGLRLKAADGGEVVAITVGSAEARKTLKEALAMGADRGVHVVTALAPLDPMRTSALLAAAVQKSGAFDIVLCSEGSSDIYTGMVPGMLAERMGRPFVGYARKIDVTKESARIERSLEESIETVEAPLPVVVSVVSEINEPRYPTLIQIMQASKKPIEELEPDQLSQGAPTPPTTIQSMKAQATSRKRVMIEGTPDEAAKRLLEALNKEGVLAG